ncbi:acetyltransferase [Brachybacterium hainanense]|uniref:Acetyltransferase n=1 Tax=Brachybacterium hainanense TaxID=1541174 RepID=A0ABV6RII4_9MICO
MTAPPPPPAVRPGWAPFLVPGTRVVLRHAIDPGAAPHGETRSDALGTVQAADADAVTIMTRRGEVTVLRGLVLAAKEVPPPPRRRPRTPPPG